VDGSAGQSAERKVVAGAALDVFEKEPLPTDSPLPILKSPTVAACFITSLWRADHAARRRSDKGIRAHGRD
jgi:lactate dehydrogenase-like 2-hydroxyacid dehydrogenase